MNIAEAKKQVRDTVEAYLAKDDAGTYEIPREQQRPVFLLGAPGIGKTAIMNQVADELGIGLVSYSMTHHTRQSALGLPFIVHHEHDGFEYEASEYTMSEIIASIYDFMDTTGNDRGILFLDEINCVSETLYPSMLQFLQFKTFGRHRVPDGWVVVCAGNPPEFNKSVHEFDIVTLDRLRKIEVEADYGVWHEYAANRGVHPAVLSFLEVKRDCFYSVESTPDGKTFVTARGWDDLSQIITLYEKLGKKVGPELVSQFVQSPEIADRFSIYYELFSKYRSDYQVEKILAGDVSEQIEDRARGAAFDEKLALIGLMLDSVTRSCEEALEKLDVIGSVRGFLKDLKADVASEEGSADSASVSADSAGVSAALGDAIAGRIDAKAAEIDDRIRRESSAGVLSKQQERKAKLEKEMLKSFAAKAMAADASPMDAVESAYMEQVSALETLIDQGGVKIDNAFSFSDRTMRNAKAHLVLVTEITSRKSTARFVAEFGSESYYAHNEELLVDEHRQDIFDRIDALGLDPRGSARPGI